MMTYCNDEHHVFEVDESMPPNRTLECECGRILKLKAWLTDPEVRRSVPLFVTQPRAAQIAFMTESGLIFR